ncbi:MAG TPA: 50S ribosomal protein L4 [Candidatus Dormibacteraeota bacterium]|jgi:large subunit ribosomal protein L4
MANETETTDQPSLTVSAYDSTGIRSGELDLPESVFGQTPHMAAMHQAYVRQMANARQGTSATKTRASVSGGGAKPYRQKGTGRARHGSTREPSMVGGGTVFGPQPRSYSQRMPRKMRRLALRSALSVKASEGRVRVVDGFAIEQPRTRMMVEMLRGLGIQAEETVLLVLPAASDVVARSTNNLPWAKIILAQNLNLYDIFTHDQLVIAKDALGLIEESLTS